MFQGSEILDVDIQAILVLFILFFVLVLFTYLSFKLQVFYILIAIWGFGIFIGIESLKTETPLSPYFEVLFLLYINLLFLYDIWEIITKDTNMRM